jgi:crotonobetainyl-CoA:carnitine CoA-transferase CaiB-like acyl-CoA transferase
MLLADLGAEVIKVEPPRGDDARTFGPFVDGTSTYYRLVNRKQARDLARPQASRRAGRARATDRAL